MGKVSEFFAKYPLFKGMGAYAILWTSSNLLQQKLRGIENVNIMEGVRYGAAGCTFVCPVFYVWLKYINIFIPGTHWQAILKKVVCEQLFYWPVAIPVFYAGTNFYEGKSFERFKEELVAKYWKTHLSSLYFWLTFGPIINYSHLIADNNRAPVAAVVSFSWATYLSYMKNAKSE